MKKRTMKLDKISADHRACDTYTSSRGVQSLQLRHSMLAICYFTIHPLILWWHDVDL
jgi:hypothetical protein